jgi:hypothetical protein
MNLEIRCKCSGELEPHSYVVNTVTEAYQCMNCMKFKPIEEVRG